MKENILLKQSLLFFAFLLLSTIDLKGQCNTTVDAGNDTTICEPGGDIMLQGQVSGTYEFVEWTPATGLSDPDILNPTASVSSTITYTLTAFGFSNNNLIVNGDFEAGNTGFTSQYTNSPTNLVPEGTYAVLPNPSTAHPNFPACVDHTFMDGTGNMMAVNGSGSPNTEVWCQTINVNPNTFYNFSAWVATLVGTAPARLQFSVNGTLLGNIFVAPTATCQWVEFNELWFSGGNTNVEICIVNQNTILSGNDFALDDIAFFEYCEEKDSVTITLVPPSERMIDTFICEGECFFIGNTPYCNQGSYTQVLPGANAVGCDSIVFLDLYILDPVAIINPPTPLSCYNDFEIVLDGTSSSFGPDVTYEWSGPNGFSSTEINPFANEPGVYQLNVTITIGDVSCTDSAAVLVVMFDDVPTAVAGENDTLNCIKQQVTLDGSQSSSGSGSTIFYEWQDSSGSQLTFSPTYTTSDPGKYSLIVTDLQSGCIDTGEVTVFEDIVHPQISALTDTISCTDTLAVLSASSNMMPIEFIWTDPNNLQQSGAVINTNIAGSYQLIGTAANGCKDTLVLVVEADTMTPVFSLIDTTILNCSDTVVLIQGPTDSSFLDLEWSGPAGFVDSARSISVTDYGSYQLRLKTANGCEGIDSALVIPDTLAPMLTLSTDTLNCTDTIGTLTALSSPANAQIDWMGPGGFQDSGHIIQVTETGTYTATAISANGCETSLQTELVPSRDIPDLTASGDTLSCDSLSVRITAASQSANASISWSGPAGFMSTLWSPTVTEAGQYRATVRLPNGCINDTLIQVNIDTLYPTLSVSDSILNCRVLSLTPTYQVDSSAILLQWTGPNNFNEEGQQPILPDPGLYTLSATAANGCQTRQEFMIGIDTVSPSAQLDIDTLTCTNPMRTFIGNYAPDSASTLWSGPAGFNSTERFPTIDQAGSYELQLLNNENGCRDTFLIEAPIDTTPPQPMASTDTINCVRTNVPLLGSSSVRAVSYSWSGPNGFISQQADTATALSGNYSLVATAANGCVDSINIEVPIDTLSPISSLAADTISCTEPAAQVVATGQPSYVYAWTGPMGFLADSSTFSTAISGTYLATIRAVNGCERLQSIRVEADTVVPLVQAIDDTLSCNVTSLTLMASTNQPNDDIMWTGPASFSSTMLNPQVNEIGLYYLTVTAANGCVGQDSAEVFADDALPQAEVSGGTLSCAQTQLQIRANILTANATGSWQGPNGFNSTDTAAMVTEAGNYTFTVEAINGCMASFSTKVMIDTVAPSVQLAADTLTCDRPDLQIQAQAFADSLTRIEWSGPNGFISNQLQANVQQAGSYQLIVTDKNGCTHEQSIEVEENKALPSLSFNTDTLTCARTQVQIRTTTSQGSLDYDWQGPAAFSSNDSSPLVEAAGRYILQIQVLENGCRDTLSVDVPIDTLRPYIAALGDTLTCIDSVASLQAISTDPAIQVSWSGPGSFSSTSFNPTTESAGLYSLVASATNGCTSLATTSVAIDTSSPALAVTDAHINCAQPEQPLSAQSASGSSIIWEFNGQPFGNGDTVVANQEGTYLAIATAENGCTSERLALVTADFVVPDVMAEGGTLNCRLPNAALSASSQTTGVSYQWTGPNSFISNNANTTTTLAGSYQVRIEGSNGCRDSVNVIVTGDTLAPIAVASVSGELNCVTDQVRISNAASTVLFPANAQWENEQGNVFSSANNVDISQAGWYVLRIQYLENGCESVDSVEVIENTSQPTALEVIASPPDCPGGLGSIAIEQVEGGAAPYLFSINGTPFTDERIFDSAPPRTYNVLVRDSIGCLYETSITVPEAEELELTMPASFAIHFTETAQLEPEVSFPENEIAFIQWQPEANLSCADCFRPFVQNLHNQQVFNLLVINDAGCELRGSVLVRVDKERHVYFPNVFSPHNQDGINDFFYPKARLEEIVEVRRMAIFDRWGELMYDQRGFQPNDPTKGWNGLFKGQPLTPAVFVYYAEIEFIDGAVELYKGDVTIVR